MDIVVVSDPRAPTRGVIQCGAFRSSCILGRGGVSRIKVEGDGATPAGRFPLRRILYRADRLAPPRTALPAAPISGDDGWCDAPGDPAYNRPVKLPYRASAETMFRADGRYDIVVVLGHNDDPVVPGAGSAIFMHVAPPDGSPTAGCIALDREALLALLAQTPRDAALCIQS